MAVAILDGLPTTKSTLTFVCGWRRDWIPCMATIAGKVPQYRYWLQRRRAILSLVPVGSMPRNPRSLLAVVVVATPAASFVVLLAVVVVKKH